MMRAACLFLIGFAGPGFAQAAWTPPQGCEVWMTLQSKGCSVANYYKCEGDLPGEQWRADFDQEGIFYKSKIDFETQWVESYDVSEPSVQTLDPNPLDPASFSELLATGRDDFSFELSTDTGNHTIVRGYDSTEGQTRVIDGVTLTETFFSYEETDDAGNVLRRAQGQEYIHPEWRLFLSGRAEWWGGESWVPYDASPMQFIFPGEKGFGATQPVFDCDAVMSGLPLNLGPDGNG